MSERLQRHIVETRLALLTHASVPLTYWSYAFAAATFMINRLPTLTLHLPSSFETLFHTPPNYRRLRIFGCLCYPWLGPYVRHKLSSLSNATEYRTVLSNLQYLCLIKPDIAFTVNKLAQFLHRPTIEHWLAVKQLLRYLGGTIHHGMFLSRHNTLSLHAFSNADWAGNRDDYSSTDAYIIYLGWHLISWSSKKQRSVVRSSIEAEYWSVTATSSELTWVCSMLSELGIQLPVPPVVYYDNIGANYLCSNFVFHSCMKHIAIDYHFVYGQVQSDALRVQHVSSADQLVDALTKPLPRGRFQELRSKIGISSRAPS